MVEQRSSYPRRRVKTLVEGYSTLRHLKSTKPGRGLALLCELTDLNKAISALGPIEYVSILLVGLIGLSEWEAAEALGVHQSTVSRRYARALEVLQAQLNGSDDEA